VNSPDSVRTSSSAHTSLSPSSPDAHPLAPYGWRADVADAFAPYEEEGLIPARIVRVDRGRCEAVTAEGTVHADTAPVATPDPTRTICTGDWAALSLGAPGSRDTSGTPAGMAEVQAVLPRRTAFLRSTATRRSDGQVLAANVDHALIAVSLAVEVDLARIERFVALAWTSGAQPLIVLTKADLVDDRATLGQLVADVEESAPGVQVLTVSAATAEGLDVLSAVIAGGTCVLLGISGAGKSTLANALLGKAVQDVRTTRDSDGKGRHTTTTRDLLPLPEDAGGGVLIDTPGLRGVGLWDAHDGVGQTFAEIEALAEECRFHDCRHESEPDCAVLAAIDDGRLPHRRLESYRKLLRENARIAARTDVRLRAEQKQRIKQQQAVGRHMMERKRGVRRKP
jgi:ribosome biogenesis GTPase / thiamine phosphate phosphatase